MNYQSISFIVFAVTILTSSCANDFNSGSPQRGNVIEKWETSNKTFRVRITAYEEKGAYLAGTYYVFESATESSNDWREFMTIRHDDRPEIPRDQVRFVNDQIGYVFMGWMYAVTTDGGNTWFVRDVKKDVPDYKPSRYEIIQNIKIAPSGTGTMTLNPNRDPHDIGKVSELHTRDYGQTWSVE